MPTDPLIPPTTEIDENPVHRICINAEWWSHVSGQISRLMHTEMWDGTDAEVYAAIQTILKFLDVGQPVDDCEDPVIYPTHASMNHQEARIAVGSVTQLYVVSANQFEGGYWIQSPAALNDEFYQSCYLAAGTYGMFILGASRSGAGILTWKIDGVNITTADDWFSAANAVNIMHYYPITVLTDGIHEIRGKVTGKNAASSGYVVALNGYWIRLN